MEAYDVVVVGGSIAGLSAALVLGRARRRVLVCDAGRPRNAVSAGVHGFFTRDGTPPAELLRLGREELAPYHTVQLREVQVSGAAREGDGFRVDLADGSPVHGRRLVLASGVLDELPAVPGLRELWGRGVYHCPYCHGWEVRDRPVAIYARGAVGLEFATMVRQWSRDLLLLTDGPHGLDDVQRGRLEALGVGVREERIERIEGARPVEGRESLEGPAGQSQSQGQSQGQGQGQGQGSEGATLRVHFAGGETLAREGLFVRPAQRQRAELAAALGCEMVTMGVEPAAVHLIKCDPLTRETSVPGVYGAGDAGSPMQSAVVAAAAGAQAAYAANHALAFEDAAALWAAQGR
ncbi:MAG TPA: NAD(P)/FAD-dependent oxidoreductase [Chloroflexota bacterium]|nr:NAD(P)/FAD-dependent oxidoreductase [Chloroflexota bacterium]